MTDAIARLRLPLDPDGFLSADGLRALRRDVLAAVADPAVRAIVLCRDPGDDWLHFGVDELAGAASQVPPVSGWALRAACSAVVLSLRGLARWPRAAGAVLDRAPGGFVDAFVLCQALERSPKPSIAAISGSCLGGSLEIALACDVRLVVDDPGARLGLPELKVGIVPGFGGTVRLAERIGAGRARALLLRAAMLSPSEALAEGLVDRVVPATELLAAAGDLAAELADRSAAVRGLHRVLPADPGWRAQAAELAAVAEAVRGPESRALLARYVGVVRDELARDPADRRPIAELATVV